MSKKAEILPELQDRVKDFNAELMPLLEKYRLGLGVAMGLTPDGRVAGQVQLFDALKKEENKVENKLEKSE